MRSYVCRFFKYIRRYTSKLVFTLGLCIPVLIFVVNVLMYINHVINVYEYVLQKPFRDFSFPLDIDMRRVVEQVLDNEYPGIQPINYKGFPSIFSNQLFCKEPGGEDADLFLLILVKSAVLNFDLRQAIRETWGNAKWTPNIKLRTLFLLGHDSLLQMDVKEEQKTYKDIEQNIYIDYDRANRTVKTMMAFRWAASNCLNAQYVLVAEDDHYVSVHNLLKVLSSIEPYQRKDLLMGDTWTFAMPTRNKQSNRYVSLSEYPYRYYPPYVGSGLFIVTPETVQQMHIAMQYTRHLRLDDAFLGIVAYKVGVAPIHVDGIYSSRPENEKDILPDAIGMPGFRDPKELIRVWTEQYEAFINKRKQFGV